MYIQGVISQKDKINHAILEGPIIQDLPSYFFNDKVLIIQFKPYIKENFSSRVIYKQKMHCLSLII